MSNETESNTSNVSEVFQVLNGHSSDVSTIDISSNNELIVSGSNDTTVRIWKLTKKGIYKENTTDPPLISPITKHRYRVNCVKFSPFSTILATTSTDGQIILWSTQNGKNFIFFHPSKSAIRCLAFSPNSEFLASGSDDETVCIWNLQTRNLLKCLKGPEKTITSVIFTNDSFGIIVGSSAGDLWYRQASDQAITKKLYYLTQAHDLGVLSIDISDNYQINTSPNDSLIQNYKLVSCGNDDLIKIWLIKYYQIKSEIKLLNVLKGHEGNINCCRFSPDGDFIVSASSDKSIKIWNTEKGLVIKEHRQHSGYATCAAFSTNGQKIISGSNDRSLIIWDYNKKVDKFELDLKNKDNCSANSENTNTNSNIKIQRTNDENITNNSEKNVNQILDWSKEEVVNWLNSVNLTDYAEIFRVNEIDGLNLLQITDDSLKKNLKIQSLEIRNKILKAIQSLKNPFDRHLCSSINVNLNLPNELYCPITHQLMIDPVVAFDGYTYERNAIQKWLQKGNNTSPMTNQILISNQVIPNHTLKLLIEKCFSN